MMIRGVGRTLFAPSKWQTSPSPPGTLYPLLNGRAWRASELRSKSCDDLQKLHIVINKEKNKLISLKEKDRLESYHRLKSLKFPYRERLSEVRKSLIRVTQELNERRIQAKKVEEMEICRNEEEESK